MPFLLRTCLCGEGFERRERWIEDRLRTFSEYFAARVCGDVPRIQNLEQEVAEPALEAADRRFRGSIGLQELLLEAAWAHGFTGRNFRDARAVLRFAFRPDLEAGFSTIDIGGILSNVANKFLLEGFFSVERVTLQIDADRCKSRQVL